MKAWFSALAIALSFCAGGCADANPTDEESIFNPNQTSATLLIKVAEHSAKTAAAADKQKEAQRYVILYDLYIKARSYSSLNKLFFWASVVSAVAVLLWPSLAVIFKKTLADVEWTKSAIVQTTVTGIAALTFAFYSQYKDKQTYAENLMRYALHSNEDMDVLSGKVTEELSKIDRGFSFSGLLKKEAPPEAAAESGAAPAP